MRKKPDSLIVLSVLVFIGVIASHFVVLNQDSSPGRMAFIDTPTSPLSRDHEINEVVTTRDIVRIDLSKRQIH